MAAVPGSVPRSSGLEETWVEQGRIIADRLSHTHWDLGDWARMIPDGVVDETAADMVGVSIGQLRTCRWLARRFPPARRRPGLGYSHHMEVAALPEETADRLLELAAEERWSVAALRREARKAAVEADIERLRSETPRQGVLSTEWLTSARRVERDVRERLISAAAALEVADDAIAELLEHPHLDAVHGHRTRAAADRLEAIFQPIAAAYERFRDRAARRFERLRGRRQ